MKKLFLVFLIYFMLGAFVEHYLYLFGLCHRVIPGRICVGQAWTETLKDFKDL